MTCVGVMYVLTSRTKYKIFFFFSPWCFLFPSFSGVRTSRVCVLTSPCIGGPHSWKSSWSKSVTLNKTISVNYKRASTTARELISYWPLFKELNSLTEHRLWVWRCRFRRFYLKVQHVRLRHLSNSSFKQVEESTRWPPTLLTLAVVSYLA